MLKCCAQILCSDSVLKFCAHNFGAQIKCSNVVLKFCAQILCSDSVLRFCAQIQCSNFVLRFQHSWVFVSYTRPIDASKLYNLGPIALLGAHLLIYKTIWFGAHLLIYKTIWCLKSKLYNLGPISLLGAHLLIYKTNRYRNLLYIA